MAERINKMGYIDTVEYYLAIKRNEILIHATAQMNLEDMLSEEGQIQRSCIV